MTDNYGAMAYLNTIPDLYNKYFDMNIDKESLADSYKKSITASGGNLEFNYQDEQLIIRNVKENEINRFSEKIALCIEEFRDIYHMDNEYSKYPLNFSIYFQFEGDELEYKNEVTDKQGVIRRINTDNVYPREGETLSQNIQKEVLEQLEERNRVRAIRNDK